MANEKKGFKASLGGAFRPKPNESIDTKEIIQIKQVSHDKQVKPVNHIRSVNFEDNNRFVKYTAEINVTYLEMLEREAYWERTTAKAIINEQMEARYKGKTFDPIPEDKRPTKRGPKKKK